MPKLPTAEEVLKMPRDEFGHVVIAQLDEETFTDTGMKFGDFCIRVEYTTFSNGGGNLNTSLSLVMEKKKSAKQLASKRPNEQDKFTVNHKNSITRILSCSSSTA